MMPSWQLEVKINAKIFSRPELISGSYYEHGCLVVLIRHDSAEIWGFRYGLKLEIGTLKIMASTGVFVCVVCAL
jgi:hypothetical protein